MAACGQSAPPRDGSSDGEAGVSDARSDAGQSPSGPGDATVEAGFTLDGAYRCCLPDQGTACCEDQPRGTCFAYGGSARTCAAAGVSYDEKDICAQCCPGLVRADGVAPGTKYPSQQDGLPEGCDEISFPSVKTCIQCGDGRRGAGESSCNCPADCPRP